MLAKPLHIFTGLILLASLTCCGGGGGDDSDDLSTNTCSTLGLNPRIINGTACSTSGSPVLELDLINRNGTASLCSGTLITPTHVLTAAHCFVTQNVQSVFTEVSGKRVFGRSVRVHPNAVINAEQGVAINDVAVVEMDESIERPTLPIITSETPEAGETFAIYGYGLDENGDLGSLESGEMRISGISQNQIVAEYDGDGSNTCNGDSGGPAVYTISNGGPSGLIGITSSGTSLTCGPGDRSFFMNLQAPQIISFIKSAAPGVQTR